MADGSSRRPTRRPSASARSGRDRSRRGDELGGRSVSSGSGSRPAFLDQGGSPSRRGKAQRGRTTVASGRERRERHAREQRMHSVGSVVGRVLTVLLVAALVLGGVYLVLRNTSVFEIKSIETQATDHVSVESIQSLLAVPEGTTLLNVDEDQIASELEKNPWVASVDIKREFPDTLSVTVNERKVGSLVLMGSGSVAWYLGEDNVWIMPAKVTARSGQSVTDAALALASEAGTLLVTGVPDTVSPVSGSQATDEVFGAVQQFRDAFSSDFSSQIVSYSASSADNVTCTLASGVEISLGAATSISSKEMVVQELLERYPDTLTYINVRVPSNPSYRKISTDQVQAGTGATGNAASESVVVGGGTDSEDSAGDSTTDSTEKSTTSDGSSSTTSSSQ